MAKLIIDTSSWLELAKPRFQEVFIELEGQVNEGQIALLTCDIILEEWKRNKDKILNEIKSSIQSHAKSADKLTEFLNPEESKTIKEIIEKYKTNEAEQLKVAERYFNKVELMLNNSEKYGIADELKIKMADRALIKQAPFHNSKNNMADAILLYGAVEYVKKEFQIATDLFFVSANHKEFGDPKNPIKLHPELKETGVYFYSNVAQALKMRKELVDEMDEYHECQFWSWIEMETEIRRGK